MNISSIGIQTVQSGSGIIQRQASQPDTGSNNDAATPPEQAPPPPGTGEVVDKTV